MDHIPLFPRRVCRVNQGQLLGDPVSSDALVEGMISCLQDSKVEFALSVGGCHCTMIWFGCRNKFQRLGPYRVEYRKRKVVPVDDNGEVVPRLGGELGRE